VTVTPQAWSITFSCGPEAAKAITVPVPMSDPKYAKLAQLKDLLDAGVLTKDEFAKEKAKILSEP
jgi:hypothetical protein